MTLGFTIALVTAACAAAHGCTICVEYEASKFEVDCHERGGHVRTLAASQHCVTDGGADVVTTMARDAEDGG